MLLSLNLLVLVFFLLLNSMATVNDKRAHHDMAKPPEGIPEVRTKNAEGEMVPLAPLAAWQESTLTRLRGTQLTRLELRVVPQASSAGYVRLEVPLERVFAPRGVLRKPELVRNVRAAAGPESTLSWTLVTQQGTTATPERLLTLARATGQDVALVPGHDDVLRIDVRPGATTPPKTGLQLQMLGEDAGGGAQGVTEVVR